jgi:hypothetical protein
VSNIDFDSGEQEFRREFGPALEANRAEAGPCPKPDLLMAARSGVAFEGVAAIERHVALCPICRQLSQDLAEYEFPPASEAEDRRIRARWETTADLPARSWLRSWKALSLAAALAASVIVVVVVRGTRQAPPPSPEAIARPVPPAPQADDSFTPMKAAIKVPAAAVLTFRGDANAGRTYLADLAAALEPYRMDDYAESARRLESLSQKYPDAAEPWFYEGVSQLFLKQNEAAVQSLESARRQAGDTLRDDISWYLALAYHRAGNRANARREAEALCTHPSEYKDRACAAASALK